MVTLSRTPATMTAEQNKLKTGEQKNVTADMKKGQKGGKHEKWLRK
jgi:hypothetical protein